MPPHPSPNLPQPDLVARAPCAKGHSPTLSHLHPAQFLVTSLVAAKLVSPTGVMILEVSTSFLVSPKTPYPCQGRDWFLLPCTSHDVTPKGSDLRVRSRLPYYQHPMVTTGPGLASLSPASKIHLPGMLLSQQWLPHCQKRGAKGTRLYGEHHATVPTPMPATCATPFARAPNPRHQGWWRSRLRGRQGSPGLPKHMHFLDFSGNS